MVGNTASTFHFLIWKFHLCNLIPPIFIFSCACAKTYFDFSKHSAWRARLGGHVVVYQEMCFSIQLVTCGMCVGATLMLVYVAVCHFRNLIVATLKWSVLHHLHLRRVEYRLPWVLERVVFTWKILFSPTFPLLPYPLCQKQTPQQFILLAAVFIPHRNHFQFTQIMICRLNESSDKFVCHLLKMEILLCRMSHKIILRGSSCVSWQCWIQISEKIARGQVAVFLRSIQVEWNVQKQDAESSYPSLCQMVFTLLQNFKLEYTVWYLSAQHSYQRLG